MLEELKSEAASGTPSIEVIYKEDMEDKVM